jgi:hypothetical protein
MTAVETLMYIDENDRFVEMENTGASLRTHPEVSFKLLLFIVLI